MNYQKYIIYWLIAALCLLDFISSPIALALGILTTNIMATDSPLFAKKLSKYLLQASVVGLGFGMSLEQAFKAGSEGFVFAACSIIATMLVGWYVGKRLKLARNSTYLISTGTAICGGSAIAAVAPVIKANHEDIAVSLGVVFVLNSVALFLFPVLGHVLGLSQSQFGLWAAIAIHDTSSVVGAANAYGAEALGIATTVKLARALWIIPLSIVTAIIFKNNEKKINVPWFIFLYIVAMSVNSYASIPSELSHAIVYSAKKGLNLTLFLIGSGLSLSTLRKVGAKPFMLGISLWVFIGVASLCVILWIM